jgi:hypothetical protein
MAALVWQQPVVTTQTCPHSHLDDVLAHLVNKTHGEFWLKRPPTWTCKGDLWCTNQIDNQTGAACTSTYKMDSYTPLSQRSTRLQKPRLRRSNAPSRSISTSSTDAGPIAQHRQHVKPWSGLNAMWRREW